MNMKKEILLQELDSLIRTLDFIQEEQSFIKRKLSSFLDNKVMNDFVIWAEELHQQILNRETAVQLLRKDVSIFKNIMAGKLSILIQLDNNQKLLYKKFKEQVVYLEIEFISWKNEADTTFESAST